MSFVYLSPCITYVCLFVFYVQDTLDTSYKVSLPSFIKLASLHGCNCLTLTVHVLCLFHYCTGSVPSDTLTDLAERILSLLQLLLDLAVVRFNQVSHLYLMPSVYYGVGRSHPPWYPGSLACFYAATQV